MINTNSQDELDTDRPNTSVFIEESPARSLDTLVQQEECEYIYISLTVLYDL